MNDFSINSMFEHGFSTIVTNDFLHSCLKHIVMQECQMLGDIKLDSLPDRRSSILSQFHNDIVTKLKPLINLYQLGPKNVDRIDWHIHDRIEFNLIANNNVTDQAIFRAFIPLLIAGESITFKSYKLIRNSSGNIINSSIIRVCEITPRDAIITNATNINFGFNIESKSKNPNIISITYHGEI